LQADKVGEQKQTSLLLTRQTRIDTDQKHILAIEDIGSPRTQLAEVGFCLRFASRLLLRLEHLGCCANESYNYAVALNR
jgi:hypothetical protein